jgi:carboxymethylenebutenolidase
MDRLGKAHEFVSYGGTGHAFLNDTRPTYRPDAAKDAWRRCVEWLSRHSK